MTRSKARKGQMYFRLIVGLLCTALFVASLRRFGQMQWRETIISFGVGLLCGYYYTSAWYERRSNDNSS
jgi:hypothetical protein